MTLTWIVSLVALVVIAALVVWQGRRDEAEYQKHRDLQKRWRDQ